MMKRKWIAAISCSLAALLFVAPFTACKGNTASNDAQTLEVYVWDAGYGDEWVSALLEDFKTVDWVREKYPELKTALVSNDQQNYGQSRVNAGSANTIDLFFTESVESYFGTDTLVDLTECVYNAEVPGEGILFKDKMLSNVYDNIAYYPVGEYDAEPTYWFVPWMLSAGGFVYNATLFEELGLTVPNTTDELFALMERVKSGDIQNKAEYNHTYTLIDTKISYINYLFPQWWAQYEGAGGYENFWNGISADGVRNSVEIFSQKGLLKALEVFHDLYNENNGYYDRSSVTYEFIAGQTRLLTREGLILPCGSWFSNEMKDLANELKAEGYNDIIDMMKTPIVSDIIEKTPSIADDGELSALIDAIDAGSTQLSGEGYDVTQADFDTIRKARGVMFGLCDTSTAVIPSAATAKEVAIDFLRYMATDRALSLYAQNTSGGVLAFDYSFREKEPELYQKLMSETPETFTVMASVYDMLEREYTDILPYYGSFPLARYGGISYVAGGSTTAVHTLFMSDADLTAERVWQQTIDYYTENNNARWNMALSNAGLR